jgi:hypothetical protein
MSDPSIPRSREDSRRDQGDSFARCVVGGRFPAARAVVGRGLVGDDPPVEAQPGGSSLAQRSALRGALGYHGYYRVGPAKHFRRTGGWVIAFSGDSEAMDKQPHQRQRNGQRQPGTQPGR